MELLSHQMRTLVIMTYSKDSACRLKVTFYPKHDIKLLKPFKLTAMKKLLLIALLFLSIGVYAQEKKELIADETTLQVLKSSVKVITCNEEIMNELLTKYKSNFNGYSVKFKKDRAGYYNQYTILFDLEKLPELREFITDINR